jgi:hypothetical protein
MTEELTKEKTMELKDYLEKSGLKQVNEDGLSAIDLSRRLESSFLFLISDLFENDKCDKRWASIAKTHFEEGGMAIRKAISMVQND